MRPDPAPEQVAAFLTEFDELCEKHNITISISEWAWLTVGSPTRRGDLSAATYNHDGDVWST